VRGVWLQCGGTLGSGSTDMKTVLVVDDHADSNEITCKLLKRLGHRTISAATGEAALALLATELPDLIILDVMMPGMNGEEVLRLIRATEATATVPVIMHSAVASPDFQDNALAKGANGFLVKSGFDLKAFEATISKFI
jgi:CheY-like chemotaxis protein